MIYWTLDYFLLLYNECIGLGISVRDFCKERGIKENRFYYWIKILKSQAVSALDTPRKFIPISSRAVSHLTQSSIEVRKESTPSVKVEDIKIIYPNGVVLELSSGFDLDMLKRLISLNS